MRYLKRAAAILCFVFVLVLGVSTTANATLVEKKAVTLENLDDGTYFVDVLLEGGTGRASIASPTQVIVTEGQAMADITWSSDNYDYMIVDGEKYEPVSTENGSVFSIPITVMNEAIPVIADTTAMSTPHEIEYTLTFDATTIKQASAGMDRKNSLVSLAVVAVVLIVYMKRQQGLRNKEEEKR